MRPKKKKNTHHENGLFGNFSLKRGNDDVNVDIVNDMNCNDKKKTPDREGQISADMRAGCDPILFECVRARWIYFFFSFLLPEKKDLVLFSCRSIYRRAEW